MLFRAQKSPTRQFHHCPQGDGVWSELEQWYASRLGELMAEQEQQQLDTELVDLFGYHLLHMGSPTEAAMLRASRVNHRMRTRLDADSRAAGRDERVLCLEPTALPFSPDTLDVVVLSHVLEFSNDPHTVLREVERSLIPEGHVVILGFNPVSLWGLIRLFRSGKGQLPWCGHFMTLTRLKDWLALLGFDVVQQRRYCYRPPWQRPRLMQQLMFMERLGQRLWSFFGGGYLLVARKRVTTLTPIRPRWRARRRIAVSGLVKPLNNERQQKGARFESDR
ncbi:class I SAM-dependent methyltransferase [Thiohalophilus sp.]|uniref:class I SAM-dependent methyltransferase n=1 Tax=Thiohalophilus sp. TaxID=3028392 RepID=UPI002ACD7DAD|nr:class I SAM-dependent methyltransferase [Thiohalophilus sp.]MDZ7663221.1 class I SAM-dependent methyltransferase [Thiohalophilus sp.]